MPYFRAFLPFWLRLPSSIILSLLWWIIQFLSLLIFSDPASSMPIERYPFSSNGFRHGSTLGGPRYIHLTKETNAVFPGFFDPLAPAAIIYNSITSVMNYLFLISSDFSDFASLSDPQTLPFFFKRVPPWFYLRRRTLYPAEVHGRI